MRTGAVVSAAGHKGGASFNPMLPIGDTTLIRRIIITLQQAGADPIVVITGNRGEELEKHISKMQVICLRNGNYEHTQMFDSICMGLSYVEGLCDRAVVLPAKFPLLFPDTVRRIMKSEAPAACPVYNGRRGHPVLIRKDLIPMILEDNRGHGLKGALCRPGINELVEEIPVDDEGILWPVEEERDWTVSSKGRERIPMHPKVQLSLACEELFFDPVAARFLMVTDHTGSMQTACRQMNMSYTKGWKLLKAAEKQLGYPLLITQSGGADGGSSRLSPRARRFLDRYQSLENDLNETAGKLFHKYFSQEEERSL